VACLDRPGSDLYNAIITGDLKGSNLENTSENYGLKVAFETLGCKLNQSETELLAIQLEEEGCRIVSPAEKADIYILNTCTVTHVADRKSRHLLRMARRRNPGARIIALGCYAERASKELNAIECVDMVIGNETKINLKQLLKEAGYLKSARVNPETYHFGRTRSFIKAQDGCNNFCSYCIVPVVRGREKSLPPEKIIAEIIKRTSQGYHEVVLTGTEIGRYNYDGMDLKGLLEYALKETEVSRLRLSSVQPQEISPELIRLWQNHRLCRHFHLSLQSGSDSVLLRMNRRYSTLDYSKAVGLIRSALPEVAVTTDIIVGFPGETRLEFQESYDFCSRMEFSRIHVFPYSIREGTRAALFPDQVEASVKKERTEKMLTLARNSLQNFYQCSFGRSQIVLFEQVSAGLWSGLTDNYIKVYTKSMVNLTNQFIPVKLIELTRDGVWGEIIQS
jgi:threonylcarbamoyladenosine tRNA methylthiotransferase MtaB